jgi:hypothetical protein
MIHDDRLERAMRQDQQVHAIKNVLRVIAGFIAGFALAMLLFRIGVFKGG